VANAKEQSKVN